MSANSSDFGGVCTMNGDAAVTVERGYINFRYNANFSGSVSIGNSGVVFVSSGCTLRSLNVDRGGVLKVCKDGAVLGAVVKSCGLMDVQGGKVCDFRISDRANCYISSAGVIRSGQLFSGSIITATDASSVCSCTVMSGGTLTLLRDAVASNIDVMEGGVLNVYDNCSARFVTVFSGGSIVAEGYHASSTGWSSRACHNGWAKVEFLNEHPGAYVKIGPFANVERDPAQHCDRTSWEIRHMEDTEVEAGDKISNAYIRGGICTISSGAVLSNCIIDSTGDVVVRSGAVLRQVTVNPCGKLHVCSGADVQFHALPGAFVRFLPLDEED